MILHKFLFQGIILIGFILSFVTIISADGTDGLTADDGSDQLSLMMMGHHHSEDGDVDSYSKSGRWSVIRINKMGNPILINWKTIMLSRRATVIFTSFKVTWRVGK